MNVLLKTTAALAVVSGLSVAQACSTAQWDAGGTATAKSAVNGSTRYEGLCALEAQQGQFVKKSGLSGSGDTYFRFYVFADTAQTGDVKIFSAESGGSEAAALTLGSGNTLKIGGKSTTLNAGEWSIVQLRVNGTTATVWVNDLTTAAISGATVTGGNVDTVTLGGSATQAGNIYFDSFVVSNGDIINNESVSISGSELLAGDASGNSIIDAADANAILKSVLGIDPPNSGVPDCSRDGTIDSGDANCSMRVTLGIDPVPTY